MNLLLLALLLQVPQAPHKDFLASPSQGQTLPKHAVENPAPKQILHPSPQSTTPHLSEDTEFTHAQMERDIGGQSEAIGELKSKVGTLEDKREKSDRPDIDDLKLSRTHFEWILGGIGIVLGTIWFLYERYKEILWGEVIRPRIMRALIHQPEPTTQVPNPPPVNRN